MTESDEFIERLHRRSACIREHALSPEGVGVLMTMLRSPLSPKPVDDGRIRAALLRREFIRADTARPDLYRLTETGRLVARVLYIPGEFRSG